MTDSKVTYNIPVYDILYFQEGADMFNNISGSSTDCTKRDIGNQIALMQEEVQETYCAYLDGDMVETLDGCIDTLYVTLGLLQKLNNLGIDTVGAMRQVAYDNLLKFPTSEMVAEETVKMYSEKGIEVISKYDVLHDAYVIKDMNDKVKKPLGFIPTDLSQYVFANCYYKEDSYD
jgi:predicted HAD superfamily Cof-like phosphohydrolase